MPGKRSSVPRYPASLHQLWEALEKSGSTCIFWSCHEKRPCPHLVDASWSTETLRKPQRDLDHIINEGLFSTSSLIDRLVGIARAFCCETHQEEEYILHYAYCWVADELLLDEYPEKKEWEAAELSHFSLGPNTLQQTSSDGSRTPLFPNESLCSIDRLEECYDSIDDAEKAVFKRAVTNLTMQWRAECTLKATLTAEDHPMAMDRSARAQSEPITFPSVRKILTPRSRKPSKDINIAKVPLNLGGDRLFRQKTTPAEYPDLPMENPVGYDVLEGLANGDPDTTQPALTTVVSGSTDIIRSPITPSWNIRPKYHTHWTAPEPASGVIQTVEGNIDRTFEAFTDTRIRKLEESLINTMAWMDLATPLQPLRIPETTAKTEFAGELYTDDASTPRAQGYSQSGTSYLPMSPVHGTAWPLDRCSVAPSETHAMSPGYGTSFLYAVSVPPSTTGGSLDEATMTYRQERRATIVSLADDLSVAGVDDHHFDPPVAHFRFQHYQPQLGAANPGSRLASQILFLIRQPLQPSLSKLDAEASKGYLTINQISFPKQATLFDKHLLIRMRPEPDPWQGRRYGQCTWYLVDESKLDVCQRVPNARRVRDIIYMMLSSQRRRRRCQCTSLAGNGDAGSHNAAAIDEENEWFEIQMDYAVATLQLWQKWMEQEPYAPDGRLKKPFMDRVRKFEGALERAEDRWDGFWWTFVKPVKVRKSI